MADQKLSQLTELGAAPAAGDLLYIDHSSTSNSLTVAHLFTSPAITTPTGIVKGDVGLGNVDNTSDATKNSASVTLTNKTLTSPKIGTSILDTNGATFITITPAATSVNNLQITNAATTFPPVIKAIGSDTNINFQVQPKGTGTVQIIDGADSTKGVIVQTSGGTTSTATTLIASQTSNRSITLPDTTTTLAGLAVAEIFTATQTASLWNTTPQALSVTTNAATADINHGIQNFTNSSASAMTITLTTTSAVDGQWKEIRIYDFSGVAQSITWVNTENSLTSAPTTSNGSTTLPLSVLFQYNNASSKWRCVATA